MKVIKNARVYVENKGLIKTDLQFNNNVCDINDNLNGEIIDIPSNAVVLPAFIDMHIHGAGNADLMDGTEKALRTLSETLSKEGTTAFLTTTLTESKENLIASLSVVKNYISNQSEFGAEVLGVHLEGPFISKTFKGAQPEQHILQPNVQVFDEFYNASGNTIKTVTLAPEIEGADELIKHLNKLNVIPAVAHSNATFSQVQHAVDIGLKGITHTFNAQSPLHHRDIGVVGAGFLLDELYSELIADTIHVSVPAMKLLFKNKPDGKIVLVTDALRLKGLTDGKMVMGGQNVTLKDGQARLDNGALAGSVIGMNTAIKNLIEKVGISFEKAVDCATINPARVLKVNDKRGSISVGKKADFAIINDNFDVLYTIKNGNIIYKA